MKKFNRIAPADTDEDRHLYLTAIGHDSLSPAVQLCLPHTLETTQLGHHASHWLLAGVFVLKTQLFLRYHKTYSCLVLQWISHDWSQSGCSVMIHHLVHLFCFYFCVSAHTNIIHNFSKDRGEADQPVFSQIFPAFFLNGDGVCFVSPSYWKPIKSSHLS